MASVKFFLVLSLFSLQYVMNVSGLHCYDCTAGASSACGTGTIGLVNCLPRADAPTKPVTCAKFKDGGSTIRLCYQFSAEVIKTVKCPELQKNSNITECEAWDVDLGETKGCNGGPNGGGGSPGLGPAPGGAGSGGNQLLPGRLAFGLIGLIISICMMGLGWTPPVEISSQQQ